MSESTPPPNPLERRRRVEFAPMAMPFTGGGQQGKTLLFMAIVVACGGVAAYMYFVQHMPLTDMRVIGPAMGALWFVLRLFMTLTPRT